MKPIEPKEILVFRGKDWLIDGRKLNEDQIRSLKNDAKTMTDLGLWKLLIKHAKWFAQVRVIKEAKTERDLHDVQEFYRVVTTFETFIKDVSNK